MLLTSIAVHSDYSVWQASILNEKQKERHIKPNKCALQSSNMAYLWETFSLPNQPQTGENKKVEKHLQLTARYADDASPGHEPY
ncbi:MAG: hypothetical protein VX768_14475 [Planctomycetota bacterium]|nr:hypothetical protein [Planctomycetota bacterium]